jgi:hypothetical protein
MLEKIIAEFRLDFLSTGTTWVWVLITSSCFQLCLGWLPGQVDMLLVSLADHRRRCAQIGDEVVVMKGVFGTALAEGR